VLNSVVAQTEYFRQLVTITPSIDATSRNAGMTAA